MLIAGGTVIAAKVSLLDEEAATAAHLSDLVDVYVANTDIPFGAPIAQDDVRIVQWPRDHVPRAAFTDASVLFPDGEGARRAKGHFVEGEILIAAKLSVHGEDVSEVPVSDAGRRAMAVQVRGEAVAGGLVGPGDQVDILLAQGEGGDMRAVTVLSGTRVLSASEGGVLTLEVTPENGQRLALAQEAGVLIASLHLGDGDTGQIDLDALDLRALLQEPPEQTSASVPSRASNAPTIVVRRGNETTIESVTRGGN